MEGPHGQTRRRKDACQPYRARLQFLREGQLGGCLPMTQVFLAYKRSDADRVAIVRQKLEALGVELFIDHQIKGGDDYIAAINNELASALAVLVFWSKAAVAQPKPGERNFLRAEAQKGWRRDVLVAATFDEVVLDNLPVPFNTFQTSDLSDWFDIGMAASHRGWQKLLEALAAKIGRRGLPTLALALEGGGERGKREFLRAFPDDVFAERFADEIVGVERAAFEKAVVLAQGQIDRRRRDGEKILRDCRNQFESQIARLRKGEDFAQPDPVKMLADEVTALREQNETYEAKLDELQDRIEQQKLASAQASERIDELTRQLDALGEQRALAEAANAATDRLKSDFEDLQKSGIAKTGELQKQAKEIETLRVSLAQTQQTNEAGRRELTKLQSKNAALKSRLPDAPWSIWNSPRLLMAAGAVAGFMAGAALVGITDQFGNIERKYQTVTLPKTDGIRATPINDGKPATAAAPAPVATASREEVQKRVAAALDIKPAAIPASVAAPASPVKTQADDCDALAGERYDRDRPPTDHWKDILEAPLSQALGVCQAILAAAEAKPASVIDRRRLHLEVGRILAAQSMEAAVGGNFAQAKLLFDGALNSVQTAADLGSSHANYILGTFYRGDIAVTGTPKGDFVAVKDLKLAWDYFMKAAQGDDPVGLTTVAFGYLLPDWTDKMVKEDVTQGRSYLDKALKTDFPRANFVLGLATIEGKGFSKNRSEGLKQIEFAFCKNDPSAQKYIKQSHLKAPTCS